MEKVTIMGSKTSAPGASYQAKIKKSGAEGRKWE